ncbi:MAG: hypothetical protein QM765_25695 [Myxococcales bacterium]
MTPENITVAPCQLGLSNAARSSSGAWRLTTILVSKSVPAPEIEILVRRPRVAIVAHHAVRDEVACARRDVEQRSHSELVDGAHLPGRGAINAIERAHDADQLIAGAQLRQLGICRVDPSPATLVEQPVIATRDDRAVVREPEAKGGLLGSPVIEHARAHADSMFSDLLRTDDLVTNRDRGQRLERRVSHQDRGVAIGAIGTRVLAAAVRVRAEREPEVRRIVLRQDRARVILDDRDRGRRRTIALVVLDGHRSKPVVRVVSLARLHAKSTVLEMCSGVQIELANNQRRGGPVRGPSSLARDDILGVVDRELEGLGGEFSGARECARVDHRTTVIIDRGDEQIAALADQEVGEAQAEAVTLDLRFVDRDRHVARRIGRVARLARDAERAPALPHGELGRRFRRRQSNLDRTAATRAFEVHVITLQRVDRSRAVQRSREHGDQALVHRGR